MEVYNSFSKKMENFKPDTGRGIIMYVCGLTPYDSAHIGHMRTHVAFDIIKRYSIAKGYRVFHIQNITDVDDKIIKRCKELGENPKTLTEKNHAEALEYFDRLNILRADAYPKVTEHIKEIIDFIKKLITNGYAYESKTGVYFIVGKFKNYGALSGQKLDEIKNGARIEIDETKNAPEDFALWKKTNNELIEFDSPFGRGRPGWHMECSAMAEKYAKLAESRGRKEEDRGSSVFRLASQSPKLETGDDKPAQRNWLLDIHGGARDLIFPHHENEIAQSEAAAGKRFCNYWLHTGFLTVKGEKMSKSLGNFITVKDAVDKFNPNAIRLFFIQTHYRSPIDYNEQQITASEESVERIFNAIGLMREASDGKAKANASFRKETKKKIKEFYGHMDDDFDTPQAVAVLFDLLRIINSHIATKKIDNVQLKELVKELGKMLWIFGLQEKKENKLSDKIGDLNRFITSTMFKGHKSLKSDLPSLKDEVTVSQNIEKIMDDIIKFRDSLRAEKKYKEADALRAKLAEIGILIEDKEKGKRWKLS